MSVLRELERKYDLHPSIKGEELAYNVGLHRANYGEGNVKTADIVRRAVVPAQLQMLVLRGSSAPLLERFNVSVERHTGTIDGRNYAGIVYGALTDDGYGTGPPSSRVK